ncbi:SICA antigen [Plasmodium coatneyi]|uniref:SICA antigen n=1 Tax=Plasmodium coatneyi TaxID=208452 RepID=A0A1B1DZ82_9APIC|nr:SICA antigen [Plasmodium coatneyi]ANQ08084.1 SICA antigen [Plasmodium coatneyi]
MEQLSQNRGGKLEWDQIEGKIKDVMKKLADALGKKEETDVDLCEKITHNTRTLTPSEKTACNNIVKGLRGIYGIKPESSENKNNHTDNPNFEQTIGCLMLNLYAQEIKSKCSIMGETVKEAFTIHEELYTTACKSGENNKCDQCVWDDCATYTVGTDDLRQKMNKMLLENKEIKKTMSTISDSPTIGEWFTRFSKDVSNEDKKQYEELGPFLALCKPDDDAVAKEGVDMETYGPFCEIMVRNIILTTAVQKKYEDKNQKQEQDQPACQKIVNGIPVCDLLKAWMWYMRWFCVPRKVIEEALSRVKSVRGDLHPQMNYVKCTYDDAIIISYTGRRDKPDDPYYDLFETNALHNKIKETTSDKTWCVDRAKWDHPIRARTDQPEPTDRVFLGDENLNKMIETVQKVAEGIKQEEGGGGSKPAEAADAPPAKVPEPPKEVVPEKKAMSEDTEQTQPGEQEPEEPGPQGIQSGSEEKVTDEVESTPTKDDNRDAPSSSSSSSSSSSDAAGAALGGGGDQRKGAPATPKAEPLTDMKDNPVLPYLPLAPAAIGISVMTYLLWKYFGMLRKERKRYRREHQLRGPLPLGQQIVDHVDDQADGPHEYTLVKEREPRSTPKKRRKKRAGGRRRGVRRRMIIDIHLEVLDECQKGNTKLVQEDFFEILVQEFMGSEFIKEEKVPKEQLPMVDVPKEQVPSSDPGLREGRLSS